MASYYVWSGAAGSANGSSWANAFTTLAAAFVTEVAGDTLYVAHDHAESNGSTTTITSSGTVANFTKVICVDRAGSVPPVSADRRATAQVKTTGNFGLSLAGFTHYDGIIFVCGDSTGVPQFNIPTTSNHSLRFDNCSLRVSASGGSVIAIGNLGTPAGTYVELNNTTVLLGSGNMNIGGVLKWRNTPSAVVAANPAVALFQTSTNSGGEVDCIGVDFSALGSGKTIVNSVGSGRVTRCRFVDCKLDAAVTKSVVPPSHGSVEIDFVRSGATGINYAVHRHRISGLLIEETTIVRTTGGASDGTTAISWKITTTANCTYTIPFECPPIAIWNDVTGSAVTATVEGIGAALPTDAEVWLDVEYLGDASSPQGSFVDDGKANLIVAAANQTSSSETWGGSTAAFKLAVTFTPQQPGWLYARVKVGKASSTFYIDPLVTLT